MGQVRRGRQGEALRVTVLVPRGCHAKRTKVGPAARWAERPNGRRRKCGEAKGRRCGPPDA